MPKASTLTRTKFSTPTSTHSRRLLQPGNGSMLRNIYRLTAPRNGLTRIRAELDRYEQLSLAL
jgi:hypothetical protein